MHATDSGDRHRMNLLSDSSWRLPKQKPPQLCSWRGLRGTSLAVQWLRIPVQEVWVRSPVQGTKDPTSGGATKPASYKERAHTAKKIKKKKSGVGKEVRSPQRRTRCLFLTVIPKPQQVQHVMWSIFHGSGSWRREKNSSMPWTYQARRSQ